MPTRFDYSPEQTVRARKLRRDAPLPERRLWFHLKSGKMGGFAFRRQHPVGPYFLDFYCAAARLAIELDGDQHGADEAVAYDLARTRFLETKGIRVLRFPNHEVLEKLAYVLEAIERALQEH